MFGKGTLRGIASGNLTLTWEICHVFVMGISYTCVIFHGYVQLSEGKLQPFLGGYISSTRLSKTSTLRIESMKLNYWQEQICVCVDMYIYIYIRMGMPE